MRDFKKIYDLYKHQVFFFISKYIDDDIDVEDVTQEVFIHLWKTKSYCNTRYDSNIIVFKIAKQEISNYYRKKRIYFTIDQSISENDTEKIDESEFELHISKAEKILDQLPIRTKEIFIKHKVDNISYSKIAKEYNVSKSAVEKQVKKALILLKSNFLNVFF
ncbi:sigma-70 family RNA polymerase sigma factor [Empedobacter falsenii]